MKSLGRFVHLVHVDVLLRGAIEHHDGRPGERLVDRLGPRVECNRVLRVNLLELEACGDRAAHKRPLNIELGALECVFDVGVIHPHRLLCVGPLRWRLYRHKA